MIEVITLSEGFIVSESVDEALVLNEIKQDNPAAFSMYLELEQSSQKTSH